ncbi:MAG: methionyl-tRNA formyltransferase, partial [Minisyncoccia bacterium]
KKFAYFGTPMLAVDILNALGAAQFAPSLVVTVPDRPKGRGMEMTETAVATWARERGIEVLKPEKLDAAFIEHFAKRDISFSIVVAYGKIVPQALLDEAPMYNIHYSLLPRWRGATPVESAILAGDKETGVALQKMVYELDAGAVVAVEKTEIGDGETTQVLRARLNAIAATLLVSTMPILAEGSPPLQEQDAAQATRAIKMTKEEGLLDLSDDGIQNYRKFRAYFGWPGTYAFFERGGKRIRGIITKAHFDGAKFVIDSIKPEGKGEMPYADFLRSGAKPL